MTENNTDVAGGVGLNVIQSTDAAAAANSEQQAANLKQVSIFAIKDSNKTKNAQYETLGLIRKGSSVVNNSNEPSYIVNARRVIINSQSDPTMICGSEGISLSSPKQVSVDSDDRVILHGLEGVYIGIPNKGNAIPQKPLAATKPPETQPVSGSASGSVSQMNQPPQPSPDYNYEPLVLGLKLQDILEDLIQVIKNVTLKCPGGDGYIREDAQWDLLEIQSRLPEILSTYAFVDGYSHPPKETLSQERPTEYAQSDVSQTGTTTGAAETANTPVNAAATSKTVSAASLPNYNQPTIINAAVANNKVTIS